MQCAACMAASGAASGMCPEPVQATLSSLMERLARDHPHRNGRAGGSVDYPVLIALSQCRPR